MGCTAEDDDDCGAGSGGNGGSPEFSGGCNAGSSTAIPMLVLVAGAVLVLRRRHR
jgi:uncharacterized protein (TIGR03382 family)